jgi:pre-mRNA-splicing factor ATP-dependent RNA helicase DHX16
LFTKWAFVNELPAETTPEILRTNLASVVLLLLSLGITNVLEFDFVDAPPNESLIKALELLYALGAMNDKAQLTKLGRQMAEFPTDPMIAKAILASDKYGCVDEVISIMSMLGESGALFYRPKDKKLYADKAREAFTRPGGDQLTLLEIWNQWVDTDFSRQWCQENFLQYKSLARARDVRDQLVRLCDRVEIEVRAAGSGDEGATNIQKAITAGFFAKVATLNRSGDSYRTLHSKQTVFIHPSSVLYKTKPKWLIYNELVLTSKEFMRNCMPIYPRWLREVAPHFYSTKQLNELGDMGKRLPKQSGHSSAM